MACGDPRDYKLPEDAQTLREMIEKWWNEETERREKRAAEIFNNAFTATYVDEGEGQKVNRFFRFKQSARVYRLVDQPRESDFVYLEDCDDPGSVWMVTLANFKERYKEISGERAIGLGYRLSDAAGALRYAVEGLQKQPDRSIVWDDNSVQWERVIGDDCREAWEDSHRDLPYFEDNTEWYLLDNTTDGPTITRDDYNFWFEKEMLPDGVDGSATFSDGPVVYKYLTDNESWFLPENVTDDAFAWQRDGSEDNPCVVDGKITDAGWDYLEKMFGPGAKERFNGQGIKELMPSARGYKNYCKYQHPISVCTLTKESEHDCQFDPTCSGVKCIWRISMGQGEYRCDSCEAQREARR